MVDLLDLLGLKGLIPSQNQPIQEQVNMAEPAVDSNTSGLVTSGTMVTELGGAAAVTPDVVAPMQPASAAPMEASFVTPAATPLETAPAVSAFPSSETSSQQPFSASIGEPMTEQPAPAEPAAAATPDVVAPTQPAADAKPGLVTVPVDGINGQGATEESPASAEDMTIGVNTDFMHVAEQPVVAPAPVASPDPVSTTAEQPAFSQPVEPAAIVPEPATAAATSTQPSAAPSPFGQPAAPETINLGGIASAQSTTAPFEQPTPPPTDNVVAFPSSQAAAQEATTTPAVSEPLAA